MNRKPGKPGFFYVEFNSSPCEGGTRGGRMLVGNSALVGVVTNKFNLKFMMLVTTPTSAKGW